MQCKRLAGVFFSLAALTTGSLVALAVPSAHAIIPCDEGCGGGGGGGGGGVDPLPGPRYALEAVWFQCVDETGTDIEDLFSDETRFNFNAIDGAGTRTSTTGYFGDVDTGESYDFNWSTRVLSPGGGSPAPLTLSTTVIEEDTWFDDLIGHSDSTFTAGDLAQSVPNVGMSTTRSLQFTGEDSDYRVYLQITRVS